MQAKHYFYVSTWMSFKKEKSNLNLKCFKKDLIVIAEWPCFNECTRISCQNYAIGNILIFLFPLGISKRNKRAHFMSCSATVTMPTTCMIYWLSRNDRVISINTTIINPTETPKMWYFDPIHLRVLCFSAWNHLIIRKLPYSRCWKFM